MGHELLPYAHKARLRSAIRRDAVHDGGVAKHHVTRFARKFDDADRDSMDLGFNLHERSDPVGRRRGFAGQRHEPGVRAMEEVAACCGVAQPLFRRERSFLLPQQTRGPGEYQGAAAARRHRSDEADDKEGVEGVTVPVARTIPMPEFSRHIPLAGLWKCNERAAPIAGWPPVA
jgi:hypothetical protein